MVSIAREIAGEQGVCTCCGQFVHIAGQQLPVRVLAELGQDAMQSDVGDVPLDNSSVPLSKAMKSGGADALFNMPRLSAGAADDDVSPWFCNSPQSNSSRLSPEQPSICEVAANDPPKGFRSVVVLLLRKNLTSKVVSADLSRWFPFWFCPATHCTSDIIVPHEVAVSHQVRMFRRRDSSWASLYVHPHQFSVVSSHDAGDGAPSARVGKHLIPNTDILDDAIACSRKDVGSSPEARDAAKDEIHASTPGSPVKCAQVIPDRRGGQPPVSLPLL
jgi:hypothetical protein